MLLDTLSAARSAIQELQAATDAHAVAANAANQARDNAAATARQRDLKAAAAVDVLNTLINEASQARLDLSAITP